MIVKIGQKFLYQNVDNIFRGKVLRSYVDDLGELVVDVEYENGDLNTFWNSSFVGKGLRYESITLIDD